jgi:SPP1 gp7 family putative phage head morphogenesis protein
MSLSLIATKSVDDIIADDEFWREIERIFAAGTSAVTRMIFHAGAEYARSAGVIADFDTINLAALRVTRETESLYWRLMTQTTRDGLREALTTWQAEGLGKRGLPDLVDSLEPLFGRERAKRVGVTETTRVFAEGNREAMAQDDTIGGEIWSTAEDELVCPLCGPLNDKIYPKGQGPAQPLHVNCRCAYIPGTWRYIRQHRSRWQGGPLPAMEAD